MVGNTLTHGAKSKLIYPRTEMEPVWIFDDRYQSKPVTVLVSHIFCYQGRCSKSLRLEETSNSRLASECIITEANRANFSYSI